MTFQLILSTDGETSFATFIYEDLNTTRDIVFRVKGAIGFDAGDESRSSVVLGNNRNDFPLRNVNVFRIDGIII